MAVTLISWLYILITAFFTGLLMRKTVKKGFGYEINSIDAILVSGIVFMTVFAEVCSIFYPVGAEANLVLIVICIFSLFLNRKEIKDIILNSRPSVSFFIKAAVFAIVIAAISSDVPHDYDTYLYHAQSIVWIEKYGAVKGLANLHNRFGYNSAFMCLQALFGQWITGRQMHQMNGFLCLFMALFACSDNFITNKKAPEAEDLLKLSALAYIIYAADSISSSGSDIMTMLLLIYLFAKWIHLYRNGSGYPLDIKTDAGRIKQGITEKNAVSYALLSMLAVFLCTVKLSAVPAVLLSLYPVCVLLKKRKFKTVAGFTVTALFIGLPYIIRNIIISGYLIYPMESLDLFDPDWKVPAEVCRVDRIDIMKFGRGINGLDGDFSLTGWLQVWFRSLEFVPRLIVCIGMISLAVFVIMLVKAAVKKDRQALLRAFVTGVSGAGFLYWLLSSPLMRYGIVVVLIFNAVTIGLMLDEKSRRVYTVFLVCCVFFMLSGLTDNYKGKQINMIFPEDYASFECKEVELPAGSGSVTVYMPAEGDQSGVDVFPATPEINPDYTELRGRDFSEGFRDKMSNRK